MTIRNKAKTALKNCGYTAEWELIPRNYGYELKLIETTPGEMGNICNELSCLVPYGEFTLKTKKSIKCEL